MGFELLKNLIVVNPSTMSMSLSIGTLLGAIGTVTGVGSLVLRLLERRKQRADLRVEPHWGYFEEDSEKNSGRKGYVSAYLEIFVDNRGERGTTIKRVIARVPTEGGSIMSAEGVLADEKRLPINLPSGESTLLKVLFDFDIGPPHFAEDFTTPAAVSMGFTGKRLVVDVAIVHTYGAEGTHYHAYPKDSRITEIARRLSTAHAGE